MYVDHLSLHDFRSWPTLDLELGAGITALLGRNGQGKTNIVEAIDYLSRLSSHRVASDAPLVRKGTEQAIVRAAVIKDERRAVLEVEINPGKSNRARINSSPLPKARELLGLLRSVVFAPDDLVLVKGDPSDRRRFLDELLVQRTPRYAGIRSDYDRVLKQRNSLLRSVSVARGSTTSAIATLEIWDERLVDLGSAIMTARTQLVTDLNPVLGKSYEAVARGAHRDDALVVYQPSFALVEAGPVDHAPTDFAQSFRAALAARQRDELDRGLTLVGPHRDELNCMLGELPVKGYASHGESWSYALAMRLASYDLLRLPEVGDADDPVLILDDVFAELDVGRRDRLAEIVADAEQVIVTAAVPEDVPAQLRGRRYAVTDGAVRADD